MYSHVLLHYDEIGTKGGNRRLFEGQLARNVRRMLAPLADVKVKREPGRMSFEIDAVPADRREDALRAVARLPGISWISAAVRTEPDLASICEAAARLAAKRAGTFKVECRRTDKGIAFDSREVCVQAGAAVNRATGRKVDVHTPDDVYRVQVDRYRAYVHDARIGGPGGLPTASAGHVVTLLSGGIDSPVAAYRMMLRGCEVTGLHLWNRSFSGDLVREKILDLGRALARHQGRFRVVFVPFEEIQRALVAASQDDVRMLLYRRAMLRVADLLVKEEEQDAVAVGDAVSQVASQTLSNLKAVYEAAESLLLTPLAGSCKQETIALAQSIGTYDVSIRPAADCCGLMVSRHPRTSTRASVLRAHEAAAGLDALLAAAFAARETVDLPSPLA